MADRSPHALGARDSHFVRLVAQKRPHEAAWGSKGSVWDDVARALNAAWGTRWNGLAARARLAYILDRFDRQRGASIQRLDADVLPLLDELLVSVASAREQEKHAARKKAADALAKTKEDKRVAAEKARDAKQLARMKERDEKRAAAVVAAAAAARAREGGVNTATVVAKRRRRKGVKTKEQKRASGTAIMFDALRQSREEYMNQLRVQTAAQAAAQALGGLTRKPASSMTTAEVDLALLRQVAKVSPFSQETPQKAEQAWLTVAERVMKLCNLKFTPTGIRDRCEALIEDFEANDCKKSTFTSGVLLADEERLSLLRVIRKAHHRRAKDILRQQEEEAGGVNSQDAAIEIEDEQTEDNDELDEQDIEEWGSLEENPIEEEPEESPHDEHVEESQIDDEEKSDSSSDSHPSTKLATSTSTLLHGQHARKRPRTSSETSPDADPAVGMDIEELQLDESSQGSTQSLDFTPRKYKERRLDEHDDSEEVVGDSEESPDVPPHDSATKPAAEINAVIRVIQAEQRERRSEFKAMLQLIKEQNADRRSEFEREHARRIREQDQRKAEMASLMEMLEKERKDRKKEVAGMLAAMAKEREDRRAEWKALMELVTKTAVDPRS